MLPVSAGLRKIQEQLLAKGDLVDQRLIAAVRALLEGRRKAVRPQRDDDAHLRRIDAGIAAACREFLSLGPTTTEARAVVAAETINVELQRAGDVAASIRQRADRCASEAPLINLIGLARLAAASQQMLRTAVKAFVADDCGDVRAVATLREGQRELMTQTTRELLASMTVHSMAAPAFDLILICRDFDRIAEHALRIAAEVAPAATAPSPMRASRRGGFVTIV